MPAKPFVFNDENVYNCYGFRVLNAGVDLTRFNINPVMLDEHWPKNRYILGAWDEVKNNGTTLTGVPRFDMEDENAKLVAGKVERGFVKSCSMGFLWKQEDMQMEPNGKYLLTKCELMEVSIVALPANANAVRLYKDGGDKMEIMNEDEIKTCLSALNTNNFQHKKDNNQMKKIILSTAAFVALGLEKITNPAEGVDASIVENAIDGLKTELNNSALKLSATEAALKTFQDKEAAQVQLNAKQLVDGAIPGKLDETQREDMMKLALGNFDFAKKLIDGLPAKTNLAAQVSNAGGAAATGEVKTMDDFQKLSESAQLSFKAENPEAYKKIVAEA
jgi:HK97 family phage prohead protease